jgi:HJR/Mrr/RecB family endonuclease
MVLVVVATEWRNLTAIILIDSTVMVLVVVAATEWRNLTAIILIGTTRTRDSGSGRIQTIIVTTTLVTIAIWLRRRNMVGGPVRYYHRRPDARRCQGGSTCRMQ